jgi:DNA-binding NarL/FixJ family response regulator
MKKILSIDSNLLNSKVIEQDVKEYFSKFDDQVEFFVSQNPQNTLDIINKHEIDIIFIDISSSHYNGIKLLKYIKSQGLRQSKIVAVTTLEDRSFRLEALKMKVYRYIYKPYDNKEIKEVLSKFFSINYYAKEINRTEHFINTEDLQSKITKDDIQTKDEDKEIIEEFEQKHKLLSAKELIEGYEEFGLETNDIDDLDLALDRLMDNILVFDDFESALPDIIHILETYNRFLFSLTEFEELSKVVYSIIILLRDIKIDELECKPMVTRLIITTIQDLVDWKEKVFIDQAAEDVFYINDCILNSYVQLQDLITK